MVQFHSSRLGLVLRWSRLSQSIYSMCIFYFPDIVTNVGSFYNIDTSVFQCPVNGLYLFSISVETNEDYPINAGIVKEGYDLLYAVAHLDDYEQGSTTVMVECSASERVWVECLTDGDRMEQGRQSSFSGILITRY